MSVQKINNYGNGNNSLSNLALNVDFNRIGEDSTFLQSKTIKVGSIIESNGSLYAVQDNDAPITGSGRYIYFNSVGLYFYRSDTEPVFSNTKGGFYGTGLGGTLITDRAIRWTSNGGVDYLIQRFPGIFGAPGVSRFFFQDETFIIPFTGKYLLFALSAGEKGIDGTSNLGADGGRGGGSYADFKNYKVGDIIYVTIGLSNLNSSSIGGYNSNGHNGNGTLGRRGGYRGKGSGVGSHNFGGGGGGSAGINTIGGDGTSAIFTRLQPVTGGSGSVFLPGKHGVGGGSGGIGGSGGSPQIAPGVPGGIGTVSNGNGGIGAGGSGGWDSVPTGGLGGQGMAAIFFQGPQ